MAESLSQALHFAVAPSDSKKYSLRAISPVSLEVLTAKTSEFTINGFNLVKLIYDLDLYLSFNVDADAATDAIKIPAKIQSFAKQLSYPAMATTATAAGMTLGPNTKVDISQPKDMKKLFRVIKTTPLVYNMIQLGLIQPEEIMAPEQQEGEEGDVTSQPEQINTQQRTDY